MDENSRYSTLENIIFAIKYVFKISKVSIVIGLISSIVSSFMIIFNLYIVRFILNSLYLNKNAKYTFLLIVITTLFTILINYVNAIFSNLITVLINEKIERCVYLNIYKKATHYSISQYDNPTFYNNYYFVLTNFIENLNAVISTCMSVITALLSSFGLIGILVKSTPEIIIIVAFNVSISFLISIKIKKIQHKYKLNTTPSRRKTSYINRIFYQPEYSKEIHSYPESNLFSKNYDCAYIELQKCNKIFGIQISNWTFIQNSSGTISNALILLLLAYRVLNHIIPISDFVVSQNGAIQLANQISSLVNNVPSFYAQSLDINRIRHFLEYNACLDTDDDVPFSSIEKIDVRSIGFSYDNYFRLDHLSITIKKGEHIAIVGPNGSGKTTLAKLLGGLYTPNYGEIFINDDCNLSALPESFLRHKIGFVFQDYKIFSFSIAENILMRPLCDKNDEALVIQALSFVGMLDKINSLPNRYNTCISKEFDENGTTFSGGELQKLALARVYAQNFDVLIFDEFTSSLDAFSESSILDIINKLSKNKINIQISHRLVNMTLMDNIFYIENGRIIEQGSHEDLMEQKGNYYSMFILQTKKYTDI